MTFMKVIHHIEITDSVSLPYFRLGTERKNNDVIDSKTFFDY